MIELSVLVLISLLAKKLLVYVVLFLLALGLILAVGIFAFSIWRQRRYNKSALPSIEEEEELDDVGLVSAFNLELFDGDPIGSESFATKLDDSYAFESLPTLSPVVVNPEETVLPEIEMPHAPASHLVNQELEIEFSARSSGVNGFSLSEDFTANKEFSLNDSSSQDEILTSDQNDPFNFEDENDEDDFTPVIERPRKKFKRERNSDFDKINEIAKVTSVPPEVEDQDSGYAGKRRA